MLKLLQGYYDQEQESYEEHEKEECKECDEECKQDCQNSINKTPEEKRGYVNLVSSYMHTPIIVKELYNKIVVHPSIVLNLSVGKNWMIK